MPTLTIPATTVPWVFTGGINSSYPVTLGTYTNPIIYSPITVGQPIHLLYLSGLVCLIPTGTAYNAAGSPTITGDTQGTNGYFPTHYCSSDDKNLGSGGLISAFTDSTGNVISVASVGLQKTLVVPTGATQLQLGINDAAEFSDNTGSFSISIYDVGLPCMQWGTAYIHVIASDFPWTNPTNGSEKQGGQIYPIGLPYTNGKSS